MVEIERLCCTDENEAVKYERMYMEQLNSTLNTRVISTTHINKEYTDIAEYRQKYQRDYREANKEKAREYCKANKDKIREYKKQYDEANKEKLLEYHKKYRESHRYPNGVGMVKTSIKA
jgi:phage terminase large subunit GpA-like protein